MFLHTVPLHKAYCYPSTTLLIDEVLPTLLVVALLVLLYVRISPANPLRNQVDEGEYPNNKVTRNIYMNKVDDCED